MHRTVEIRRLFCRSAEVNGTKPKSLRTGQELPHRQQKSRAREVSLLSSISLSIGVLSDDFAAVDVREVLCYHSLTEKANSRGAMNGKNQWKKAVRGGKSGSRSPSGLAGTAPRRRAFGLVFPVVYLFLFRGVCLAAARRSRAALVYAKHTPPNPTSVEH